MEQIVKRSQDLGVGTNEKKLSRFQHKQKFIGFVWNGFNKTVRLPEIKLEERKDWIRVFLVPDADTTYDKLEIFIGRLIHVSYLLPHLKCYLNGLHRMKNDWVHNGATRKIPKEVVEDMQFWLSALENFTNMRLISLDVPKEIGWVGDASTSFGIGVLIGNKWSQFSLLPGWESSGKGSRGIAWLETVSY